MPNAHQRDAQTDSTQDMELHQLQGSWKKYALTDSLQNSLKNNLNICDRMVLVVPEKTTENWVKFMRTESTRKGTAKISHTQRE